MMGLLLVGCAQPKPSVWYCLAYNTPNNLQYKVDETSDRGWSRVHASSASQVRWRVDAETPTKERLRDVDLVVILNPEAKPWEGGAAPRLMQDADIEVLVDYVKTGGALLFASNQDYKHNIEKPQSNRLLQHFGMRMGNEDIGVKQLEIPKTNSAVGGLRWRFFFGSGVTLTKSGQCRREVWAWNDPQAPTLEGKPGDRVPLMAAAEVGSGRVIVVGDSGWTANGTIGHDDNWPVLWGQMRWLTRDRLSQKPPMLVPWSPPDSN